jgi:predicted dehydrogenase
MIGSEAILRLDLETQSVVKYTRGSLQPRTAALSQIGEAIQLVGNTLSVGTKYATGTVPSSHDLMARQFVDCIVNDKKSPVPAEEGRETVRVLGLITEQLDRKYAAGSGSV